MTSAKKIKKQTVKDAFDDLDHNISNGLDFAGRGSIDAFDLVDSYKKVFCSKIVEFCSVNGLDDDAVLIKTNALALAEIKAVFAFRTERLTLERLAELYSALAGDKDIISNLKLKALTQILNNKSLTKLKLNDSIRGLILSNNISVLSLDFLLALIEKLDLISDLKMPLRLK